MKTSESRYCSCIYFSSAAFARKIEKIAVESWKPVGLAPSHGYLLMNVIDEPGIQPGALADQLQLQPSTITRLIEKLEEKKMVRQPRIRPFANPITRRKETSLDSPTSENDSRFLMSPERKPDCRFYWGTRQTTDTIPVVSPS